MRWAVAMTVREPAALVLANVGWHLGTGAAEVHVYFDDPSDPAFSDVAAIPGVQVTRCDAVHWRATGPRGARPESVTERQSLNANHARALSRADWIVHLDADEFLVQERPLVEELAAVAQLDAELHFPVAERAFVAGAPMRSLFEGVFRLSTRGQNRRKDGGSFDEAIFGEQAPVLIHGVLGHSGGKSAVPVSGDFRIGIHWAYRGAGRDRAERWRSTTTRLLHFDGLTRAHWMHKMRRYLAMPQDSLKMSAHRRAQLELFAEMEEDRHALFDALYVLDEARLARLRGFGLLAETRFDPQETIGRVLGQVPDLSPAAFDRALTG
ncbi:glycosyltransferase family 2 protein [Thetidibacter halocola]|uniref:Glycosyltransferase family 2 protein n=1 Tax=Thetidibacter halocola TaxID=2827239 RepID=A0A8J8B9Z3_9RHOB|nr:glycosyltransferase family 2 protein [Thetidibacter halocola]MBS0124683.1 glycosyltransferase family 2 protein [Thetidibacter halocola]